MTRFQASIFTCWLSVSLWLVAWLTSDQSIKDQTDETNSRTRQVATRQNSAASAKPKDNQRPPSLTYLKSAPAKASLSIKETLPSPLELLRKPETTPQAIPRALHQVIRSSVLHDPDFAALRQLKVGDSFGLPVGPHSWLQGKVTLVEKDEQDLLVGGLIAGISGHEFSFRLTSTRHLHGTMLAPSESRAWVIEPHTDGRMIVQEKPIDAVICTGMPLADPSQARAGTASQFASVLSTATLSLDSLPLATAVFYLDFDGAVVRDPLWNGGNTMVAQPAQVNGRIINNAEVRDVWERVAEDFRPFQITVTTNEQRYLNAPVGFRMRCIVTPTRTAAPAWGGVAYLHSFSRAGTTFSDDIPCWSFNSGTPQIMAVTISHELGHTVGLMHDGRNLGYSETYYYGHGSGNLSWGPLMGAPFDRRVSQWSKGDYLQANLFEDDVAVIANQENAFGFRPDTAGNSPAEAALINGNFTGTVRETGIILSQTDRDVYRFINQQGAILFTAKPNALDPNLKIKLELLNSAGDVIATDNPTDSMAATLNRVVPAGEHFIRISGAETGNPLGSPISGFTHYGSIGGYELTGAFTPLPMNPYLVEQPQSQTVVEKQSVLLQARALSHSRLRYQWFHSVNGVERPIPNATSATFRINSTSEASIGRYRVRIRNAHGTEFSEPASVQVLLRPRVKQQDPQLAVNAGETATLSPTFVGEPSLTFQWFKDQQPISGATEASLTLASSTWADAGTYHLRIHNHLGETVGKPTRLTVHSPPVLLSAIPTLAVPIGGSAVLSHRIAGSQGFSYQWLRDSTPLPSANTPTLRFKGAPGIEGSYTLQITNAFGQTFSQPTQVTLAERLRITTQPTSQITLRGQSVQLAVAVTGSPPFSYQWQKNGRDLPGANQRVLTLPAITWSEQGQYRVLVSNLVTRLLSRIANVEVISRPEILIHPGTQQGPLAGSTRLQVLAGGSGQLTYQWFKDFAPIPQATSATLVLRRLSPADQGLYTVQVSNAHGQIESNPAALTVVAPPTITLQPQPGFFPLGGEISVRITATGAETLRYQWQHNQKDLPGQTQDLLTIPAQSLRDSGSYRCIVRNSVGRIVSRNAAIQVQTAPSITVQPTPATLYEGENLSLSVNATGSKPLTYQWRRNGQPVGQERILNLRDVRLGMAGNYDVVITNRVGRAVSMPVAVNLLPVPPPNVELLVPTRALPAGRFSLIGHHLQFVRTLHLGTRRIGFVKLESGELLASAPSDLRTPLAGAPLRVTSLGGEHWVETPLFIGTQATNDAFQNSAIITGATVFASREVTTYSSEPQEYGYQTAWWRWIAPRTGLFTIDTIGSNFDTVAAIYVEPTPASRELIGQNDDFYGMHSRVDFPAIKGIAYRISVGSFQPLNQHSGRFFAALSLYPKPAFGLPSSLSPAQPPSPQPPTIPFAASNAHSSSADLTEAVRLGGSHPPGNPTVVSWHPALPADQPSYSPWTITFDAAFDSTPPDSTDEFVFTLYNTQDHPILAIVWQAISRQVKVVNISGQELPLPNVQMELGSSLKFSLSADPKKQTWQLLVEGEPVVGPNPLSASNTLASGSHFSFGWLPSGASAPSCMQFENLSFSSDPP